MYFRPYSPILVLFILKYTLIFIIIQPESLDFVLFVCYITVINIIYSKILIFIHFDGG